jgi:hypothetical protein
MNELRITNSAGEILYTTTVALGSEWNARRVPALVAGAFALGGRVEVRTTRGWSPRRVVRVGRSYYLRVAQ